jgi:methionine-rich copper-binding protein CopC
MTSPNILRRAALPMIGIAIIAAASAFSAPVFRHTALTKSEPAKNDTLSVSPKVIKLWFSEPVVLTVTKVKLTNAAGAAIALGALAQPGKGEDLPVIASVSKLLTPGAYTVTWSTAADDGHPAKGTFGFVVKGH